MILLFLSTLYLLHFIPCFFADNRNYIDYLPDGHVDKDKTMFTRFDFLRIDVPSIGTDGNKQLKKLLDPHAKHTPEDQSKHLEIEQWDNWKNFPNFEEYPTLTEGRGLDLMAWLVHTFSSRVIFARLRGKRNRDRRMEEQARAETSSLDSLTLDDFTFIFCQVQHNINKWNLFYKAWKTDYIKFWEGAESIEDCEVGSLKKKKKGGHLNDNEDDKDEISPEDLKKINDMNARGYEYKDGSGFNKGQGKIRYNSIKKYLYHAYYNPKLQFRETVRANRKALDNAIKALADRKREIEQAASPNTDNNDEQSQQSSTMPDLGTDPELDEIHAFSFNSHYEPVHYNYDNDEPVTQVFQS